MRRDRLLFAALLGLCLFTTATGAVAQSTAQTSMVMDAVNMVLRWAHVLFGILWIGHLYFFNFVQGGFEGKLTADIKKAVIPELRPRALFWFRWGAMWTWVTGLFLLGIVYYMGLKPGIREGELKGWSTDPTMGYMTVAAIFVVYFVYDLVAKKLGAMTPAGLGVSVVLLAGMIALFGYVGKMDGRALFIHTGGLLGTAMMMNVWMRIWPAQRKIITAIKAGTPPDAALVALAGGRSRHNTYMSVPLLMLMISNHYPTIYGDAKPEMKHYLALVLIIAIGFAVTKALFAKAGKVTGF